MLQKMPDQQTAPGRSQYPGSGSTGTGDSKQPQAVQHEALKLRPTMRIVKDLEAVPRGCSVHGYSLVRGQMLRGGTLCQLSTSHAVNALTVYMPTHCTAVGCVVGCWNSAPMLCVQLRSAGSLFRWGCLGWRMKPCVLSAKRKVRVLCGL